MFRNVRRALHRQQEFAQHSDGTDVFDGGKRMLGSQLSICTFRRCRSYYNGDAIWNAAF